MPRKPLLTFFVLAYLISWIIWLPLYGHVIGLPRLPLVPFHHGLGGLGPLAASFLTTWIYYRKKGVKNLLARCLQFRPLLYLVIALVSPFLLALAAAGISHFVNEDPVRLAGLLTSKEFPEFSLLTLFFYNLLFFGFGEEVGWRGFALPRLQKKYSALAASLILTLFWAFWHLPLFFYRPGYTSMDAAGIIGWVFSLLTGSFLLTWLYNASRGSILICAVFHATIDIAFTTDMATQNITNYLGALITIWGILTIFILKRQHVENDF